MGHPTSLKIRLNPASYFPGLSDARNSIGGDPAKVTPPVGSAFKSAVVGAITDHTSNSLS